MTNFSKKIKILYIGNFLAKHGFYPSQGSILVDVLQKKGWDISWTSSIKNKVFRLFSIIFSIIRFLFLSGKKASIIDFFSGPSYFYASFLITLIHVTFNLKYILVLHGGNIPKRIKNNPLITKFIFKNSFYVICPSDFFKDIIIKELDLKNILVIPNAIYCEKYNNCDIGNVTNIVYLRSFHKFHDPVTLIKAFSKVLKTVPNARLTLIGFDEKDGTYEESIKQIKTLSIEKCVTIKGPVNKKEVPLIAKKHAIFVNCSLIDNTPVSTIEAMAMGMCIIGTNVGGIPYLIKDNFDSIIIEPKNAKALADSILRIINNKELALRLSKQAKISSEKFDWKKVTKEWEEFLNATIVS
jgi:glycosyltransferase involved in cell wall biosynthesis